MDTDRSKKLLLLSFNATNGGTEQAVISLARGMMARGWEVAYAFPCASGAQLMQWCQEAGVPGFAHPAIITLDSWYTPRRLLALWRFMREQQADVVNLHYGYHFIRLLDVVIIRLAGYHRLIATVNHPAPWTGWKGWARRIFTGMAAPFCPVIVTICRAMRSQLTHACIPLRKVHIIYPGVRSSSELPSRNEARNRLGISPSTFVISTLARLVPGKGIDDLIKAAARAGDQDGNTIVLIGGDGPERSALERLAAAVPNVQVRFLGRVSDTSGLYAAADVFALPSYMEGFGMVYVEAARHGVPSIGTAVGGIPDAVVDGETGLLVPPRDIDALAAAICRLRDDADLRMRLGQAARLRAQNEFTEAHMAERYIDLIHTKFKEG